MAGACRTSNHRITIVVILEAAQRVPGSRAILPNPFYSRQSDDRRQPHLESPHLYCRHPGSRAADSGIQGNLAEHLI
ncbi:hypothetical protein C7S18_11375 [Ahniella affigens]|uniref:Uncharacterized protein n=1 Tax=Ahniella affigens TaxID=2021234 RepID=A0A2P1PSE8_9GAMM|nr:hypothetical protein C7S18_11375 [Ahniella affigens]